MRQESDFLGSKDLPDTAYWGVHAARAVENFPITGHSVAQMPHLIRAFAYVKKAAAAANLSLGTINAQQAQAIAQACDDRGEKQRLADCLQTLAADDARHGESCSELAHARPRPWWRAPDEPVRGSFH